jgi:hypothetical protein
MKIGILLLCLSAFVCNARRLEQSETEPAGTITPIGNVELHIIDNTSSTTAPMLNQAVQLIKEIFATAGVHVEWDNGGSKVSKIAFDRRIIVDITDVTPWNYFEGALGYSRPYEGVHVTVFYDRVYQTAPDAARRPLLLAHVLVHEITHALQGVEHHSESGIMKAHWGPADYYGMAVKPLPFTPEDILMLKMGMRFKPVQEEPF